VKCYLQSIYEKKIEFIRPSEQICQRDDKPILEEIYEDSSPGINANPAQRNNSTYNFNPSFNYNQNNVGQNIGGSPNQTRGNINMNYNSVNVNQSNNNNIYDNLGNNSLSNYRLQTQPIVSKLEYKPE